MRLEKCLGFGEQCGNPGLYRGYLVVNPRSRLMLILCRKAFCIRLDSGGDRGCCGRNSRSNISGGCLCGRDYGGVGIIFGYGWPPYTAGAGVGRAAASAFLAAFSSVPRFVTSFCEAARSP